MTKEQAGRLTILSGPSCVGKSPLNKALARFYPELRNALQPLVLYNSRAVRPGEVDGVDYHFRTREHWDAFYYPLGDARKALLAFVSLLEGKVPAGVEQWEQDLIP